MAKRVSTLLEPARPLPVRSTGGTIATSSAPVLIGIALAGILHFVLPGGEFYTKIVMDAGIAIILAVSLNIVNGMTGQFSLGHAAFMALGG
jgi:branched-chain amino acid transport system permease protein